MNSLHLWPDPVAGLREIRRVLGKSGRIAIAITRFSYASADQFEQHLTDAGFKDVRVHTDPPGIYALGRA